MSDRWYRVALQYQGYKPFGVVRVARSTDKSVWLVGKDGNVSRHARLSRYETFVETWDEAVSTALSACDRKVNSAKSNLAHQEEVKVGVQEFIDNFKVEGEQCSRD